jgi:hypothetical protein
MNDRYKEMIKYHTEILRVIFVVVFADITGIISLIKRGSLAINEFRLIFAGLFVIFAMSIVIIKLNRKITSRIKKLR